MCRIRSAVVLVLVLTALPGCSPQSSGEGSAATGAPAVSPIDQDQAFPVTFTDVTAQAGIAFRHNSGAFGRHYFPETLGSGAAFLDADADGWQDVLFVNSTNWAGHAGAPSFPALYRNNHDGTFSDITAQAGLQVETYGLGVSAADFDNDGFIDIYLTTLGPNRLFRNVGGVRFVDVTARAGVGQDGFWSSAAWLDYDRDGRLDLFALRYVDWSVATDAFCTIDGTTKSYCGPELYKGRSPALFRNLGEGRFQDVTAAAGLLDPTAKGLGVALLDYDNDGWLDLFAANDLQRNRLYRNNRNGTFTDVGIKAGVAYTETGVVRAGMGTDAADYDGSGRASIIVGNLSHEMMALYTNEGSGRFVDHAAASTIGKATRLSLTFGTFFFDVDLDGRLDIFAANGHIQPDISKREPNVTYAQMPNLLHNLGSDRFTEVRDRVGAAMREPMVGRGAAYADYDRDGDLDLLVTTNNGPARLLRNDGGNRNNFLRVSVIGRTVNRDGIGTKIEAMIDGRPGPWAMVKTGSSYLSQSELPVTFGLGSADAVSGLRVTWPNGAVEHVPALKANQSVTIVEGRGVLQR